MNNRTDILSLRDALTVLRQTPGQLIETSVEVDPAAELSGVYRYVGAGGTVMRPTTVDGPAMVFHNVKGHPVASVAIGVLASRERVANLFGCKKEELGWLVQSCAANPIQPIVVDGPASHECWLLKAKAVTHRQNPIMQTCIGPSEEHVNMAGIPTEASILGMIDKALPGKVLNCYAHRSGGGKYMAVLQCKKTVHTDEGKQRQAALLAFSAFPELKHVILVNEDVDIFDPNDVLWAMNTRFQGDKDIITIPGVRCHPLDPSSNPDYSPSISDVGISCKTIFDCTVPFHLKDRFQRAPFLDVNPEKWLCQKGIDFMSEGQETCPMCENHCPVTELRCGRGRAHFGLTNDAGDHPRDGGHHHGHEHGHGHHRGGHGRCHGGHCVRLLGQSAASCCRRVPEGAAEAGAVRPGEPAVHHPSAQSL